MDAGFEFVVLKVQRPLASNDPNNPWLIYSRDRKFEMHVAENDVPEILLRAMRSKSKVKIYVNALCHKARGSVEILKVLSPSEERAHTW